jgi:hypothetical protein
MKRRALQKRYGHTKAERRLRKRRAERSQLYYYSVLVPYVATGATKWHPTEATGPFSTLSRGAFDTRAEADAWARAHLNGKPYYVRKHERGLDTLESSAGARFFRRMNAAEKAEVVARGLKVGR